MVYGLLFAALTWCGARASLPSAKSCAEVRSQLQDRLLQAESLEKEFRMLISLIAEHQVIVSACADLPAESSIPSALTRLPEGSHRRSALDSVNGSCAIEDRICPAEVVTAISAVSESVPEKQFGYSR